MTRARCQAEHEVVRAVLYAMRSGALHPVRWPGGKAPVRKLVRWGALRNLHDKVAALAQQEPAR